MRHHVAAAPDYISQSFQLTRQDGSARLDSARQVIHKAELKHLAAFSLRGAEIL